MAPSTTPPNDEPLTLPERVAVAYSGGRDSTALLHATARMARELGNIQVFACHVHHGLSVHADAWLAHAQQQCQQWAAEGLPVVLYSRRLHLSPLPGQSIEAWARQHRYAALADMAKEAQCNVVLLAHHQQDQAETFLLQALRGAGVAGLACMPPAMERHGVTWLRPWLRHSPQAVAHYIDTHGLTHIVDDSNADARLARNRLRLQVWPAMQQAFGQAQAGLSQSAAHLADVLASHQAWLASELPRMLVVPQEHTPFMPEGGAGLDVRAWLAYPAGQQRELLRAWFYQATQGHTLPSSWVLRLQSELARQPASAHWPVHLKRDGFGGSQGHVTLYRGVLCWHPLAGQALPLPPPHLMVPLHIEREGTIELPQAKGRLHVRASQEGGVSLQLLNTCQLRHRQGGEQFQCAQGRPARSLKKQFQGAGVPAWARHAPLLWASEQLVFVPGLGIDARVQAQPGIKQVSLAWEPDAGFGSA